MKEDIIANVLCQSYDSIDMLELARDYCEFNMEKSSKFNALAQVLGFVIKDLKKMAQDIDTI